jgi:hypothetical protein
MTEKLPLLAIHTREFHICLSSQPDLVIEFPDLSLSAALVPVFPDDEYQR